VERACLLRTSSLGIRQRFFAYHNDCWDPSDRTALPFRRKCNAYPRLIWPEATRA